MLNQKWDSTDVFNTFNTKKFTSYKKEKKHIKVNILALIALNYIVPLHMKLMNVMKAGLKTLTLNLGFFNLTPISEPTDEQKEKFDVEFEI